MENKDAINPTLRSIVYVSCLAVTTVSLIVTQMLAVFGVIDQAVSLQIMGVVGTASAYLSSGLGTAYRPVN